MGIFNDYTTAVTNDTSITLKEEDEAAADAYIVKKLALAGINYADIVLPNIILTNASRWLMMHFAASTKSATQQNDAMAKKAEIYKNNADDLLSNLNSSMFVFSATNAHGSGAYAEVL